MSKMNRNVSSYSPVEMARSERNKRRKRETLTRAERLKLRNLSKKGCYDLNVMAAANKILGIRR